MSRFFASSETRVEVNCRTRELEASIFDTTILRLTTLTYLTYNCYKPLHIFTLRLDLRPEMPLELRHRSSSQSYETRAEVDCRASELELFKSEI